VATHEYRGIRDYLEFVGGWKETNIPGSASIEKYVIEHGREYRYTPGPLPGGVERGYAKECFGNCAIHVITQDTDLTYVEGFASWSMMPVAHAWLVDKDGNVIDPTWVDDDVCGLCLGEGERSEAIDWDEDGDECDWENVDCRFCDGTGKTDADQRAGADREYLGVPFDAEYVRERLLDRGVYGLLDDPKLHEKTSAST
jgi:hypothetical protein